MIADTIDYGDQQLGIRCESVCYSVQTFAVKCSGALVGFMVGGALTLINYVPNQVQTAEAAMGIQMLYLAPSLLCFVAYFIYRNKYKLNGDMLDQVQSDLQQKYEMAAA